MTGPSKPALGRLVKVDLRDAWGSEATDFTPWLARAENIALLGEAIGIELEVESQEKDVGPFRADILCRDTINGHFVLVENQLERTDHTHLGQLLTYAAGLDAVTVVWIAARFTDEHRAALDWLNNATTESLSFFGLEIELWRIGESPMAPQFTVVSKPNEFSKEVRARTAAVQSGDLSESQRLHLQFWTQFHQFLEDRGSPIHSGRPSSNHWTNVSVGRTYFSLFALNNARDQRSAVYLSTSGPNAKAHYGLIEQRYRAQVEQQLSSLGKVEWRELPNRLESQIYVGRPSTPSNSGTWPELDEWMARTLETMHALFAPIVKSLDASAFVLAGDADGKSPPDESGGDLGEPVAPAGEDM